MLIAMADPTHPMRGDRRHIGSAEVSADERSPTGDHGPMAREYDEISGVDEWGAPTVPESDSEPGEGSLGVMGRGLTVIVREQGRSPLRIVVTEPIEVGRECTGLILTDAQISRRHLELRLAGGRIVVTDLGSTNGTTVDGVPITAPTPLTAGSRVMLGDSTIELEADLRGTMVSGVGGGRGLPDLRRTSIDLVADAVAQVRPDVASIPAEHGTVTIVFSDIENSTLRAEMLGDQAWFELLTAHNRIVRHQVQRHGGKEVKSQGDGFMLTFPSARAAVQCTIDIQRDIRRHNTERVDQEFHIRIGMHIGEAIVGDGGDLFGKHVNLAARVANEAGGDEILVSSLVRQIVEARGDIEFGEPRTAELKGLAGTHILTPITWG
jgi:class 3 adenylate cyclase